MAPHTIIERSFFYQFAAHNNHHPLSYNAHERDCHCGTQGSRIIAGYIMPPVYEVPISCLRSHSLWRRQCSGVNPWHLAERCDGYPAGMQKYLNNTPGCHSHTKLPFSIFIWGAEINWLTYTSLAVFHLSLTVGVFRFEVQGSKWNSSVRGNCGNLGERWQVGNNQWQLGNNPIWRHRNHTTSDMYFSISSIWTSLEYIWLTVFWFNCWSTWSNNLYFQSV